MQRKSSTEKGASGVVREPVQVYLSSDDARLLARLSTETGLSKAEVLRQGMRSYARDHGQAGTSPMLRFIAESPASGWPKDVAKDHDKALAAAYTAPRKKRR
ncbi:MAG: hypothetical protein U0132_18775 [Gemmatimonadaceae bacterium]